MGSPTSSSGPYGAGPNGSASGASYLIFGRDAADRRLPGEPIVLSILDGAERLSPERRRGR